MIHCPVEENIGESITWYKDFHLIPNTSDVNLEVYLPSDYSKRIYTCIWTWEHHGQVYNTSGSVQLQRKKHASPFLITFQYPINNSVVFVELGAEVTLNCLVFFGIGMTTHRNVYWMKSSSNLNCSNRYEDDGISSRFTISQVSETDLQEHEYCCIASSLTRWDFACITLKARQSLLPVIVTFSCLVLILLLAVGMPKLFGVNLILFWRSFRIMQRKRYDGKVYDAYVIYPKDDLDENAGNKVAHFVHKVLPAVLENACGFKLFISGRDDLPGEDCIALTETRMQLSRRLIAVLPPGDSQHRQVPRSLCYDWNMGLHRVLVEEEPRVIFIQLGDRKENSHLPLGLRHLLQKTPPLRWDERSGRATCRTSSFWKRVRYMMPVPPDCAARAVSKLEI